MSETRFTPEELTLMADTLVFVMEEGSPEGPEMATDMLRQAAQDARVIEQLRAFINERRALAAKYLGDKLASLGAYAAVGVCDAVLAELDRLAPPERQE